MDEMFVSVYLIDPATGGLKAYSDIQPRDGDLTSIAALSGTAGLLKKTAANTWELDTAVYATTAYADSLVVGLLDDRGNYDASPNTFPAAGGSGSSGAIKKGDLWTISVAGTLGGVAVTAGDLVRALADTPGQTAGNWAVSETNIGYAALNASLLDGKIYVGNGSNIGTAVTPSGDITISNAGVTAIGASKVTNTMLAGSIALSKITITGTPDGAKYLRDDGSWQTFPTLNQNTTGSAATLTTPRNINGVAFDGSSNITVTAAGSTLSDTVTVAKGGTGLTAVGTALQVLRTNAGATAMEWADPSDGSGITTLNTLTGATQTFAVGTSGSDLAWLSSGTAHTLNLPDAGASARGAITTGSQTIAGDKTFSGVLAGETNIVVGTAAVSTSATGGFIYGASCAGLPTGTPTAKTGRVAEVYDSTNSKSYKYNGAWKFDGAPSAGIEAQLAGSIPDATYTMVTYAPFSFVIDGIFGLKTTSGTATLAVKINGTNVTGLSSLSVTSSAQDATASAANVVAVGDAITFVVSSGSTPVDLLSTLKITRT